MKKKLDDTAIINELKGSAFFPRRNEYERATPPLPQEHEEQMQEAMPDRPSVRTYERTDERTSGRASVRKKIRHALDIFDDQIISLREMAIEREKVFGRRVTLGELAQEALDMFITTERNKG